MATIREHAEIAVVAQIIGCTRTHMPELNRSETNVVRLAEIAVAATSYAIQRKAINAIYEVSDGDAGFFAQAVNELMAIVYELEEDD